MSRFAVVLSTIVVVGLAICSAGLRGGAQKPASSLSPEAAVTDYCAAWNTEDPAKRERLLSRVWAPNGVYSDPDPTYVVGPAALSNAISNFQRSYPGMYFKCSPPQVHHGVMRVAWILFRPDGSERLRGTDFSELASDGRIRRVSGFFGPPPEIKP